VWDAGSGAEDTAQPAAINATPTIEKTTTARLFTIACSP
jgi:hypothetical protein